jgi:hypothetical protein
MWGNLGFLTTIQMDRRPPPSLVMIRLRIGIDLGSRNRADREKRTEEGKASRIKTFGIVWQTSRVGQI